MDITVYFPKKVAFSHESVRIFISPIIKCVLLLVITINKFREYVYCFYRVSFQYYQTETYLSFIKQKALSDVGLRLKSKIGLRAVSAARQVELSSNFASVQKVGSRLELAILFLNPSDLPLGN